MHQKTLMKKSSSWPSSQSFQGPRPRGNPFHMSSCLLPGLNPLGRRGRHFGLLPRQFWESPLAAREGFSLPDLVPPSVCFSMQLLTLSLSPDRLNSTRGFKFPSFRHCWSKEGGSLHCKKLTDHRGFTTKGTLSSHTAHSGETEAQGNKKKLIIT